MKMSKKEKRSVMKQFLNQNGGLMIKLRMASELTECGNQEEVHKFSKKILAIDKIETTLNYFDEFKDFHSYSESEYIKYYEIYLTLLSSLHLMCNQKIVSDEQRYKINR